jgi:hypothetical protein
VSAPVRIEARAWTDIRFATLARILGLADADHALIKVARLWSWQTEHYTPDNPTYEVDADTIESVLGDGGAAALVRAKLADQTATGYRLRGTEGQIEWCDTLTSKRQHAGRARAAAAKRDERGRLISNEAHESTSTTPAHVQHATSTPPAQSSAPTPDPSPEEVLPPARDPAVPSPAPAPEPILPASQEAAEKRRRLIGRAWTLAGEAFRRVQASGIDPTQPNGWNGLPSASSPPMQNLRAIVDELLIGENPDYAGAEAKIANRVLVAEADARSFSPPTARYMTPARMWNRESFSIAVDLSPEQAASSRPSRAGPTRSAERASTNGQQTIRPKYSEPDEPA